MHSARPITAFVAASGQEHTRSMVEQLRESGVVEKICLLTSAGDVTLQGCAKISIDTVTSTSTMRQVAELTNTPLAMLVLHDSAIDFGQFAVERLANVATATGA